MILRTESEAVFACYTASCRPPTSGGTGGSGGGAKSGGRKVKGAAASKAPSNASATKRRARTGVKPKTTKSGGEVSYGYDRNGKAVKRVKTAENVQRDREIEERISGLAKKHGYRGDPSMAQVDITKLSGKSRRTPYETKKLKAARAVHKEYTEIVRSAESSAARKRNG